MSRENLHGLADLTSMLYRVEQARMRELNEKESKLRRALTKLETCRKTSLALPADDLAAIRQIGADILWQGWVGRNRAELNRQLALCLAQKARMMDSLRQAHGKHIAAEKLLEAREAALRKAKNRHRLIEDQNMLVARAGKP